MYTSRMQANRSWKRLSAMVAPKEGAWLYQDAHYLVADVEIDPAAARSFPAKNTVLPAAEMQVNSELVLLDKARSPIRPPQPSVAPSGLDDCHVDC